jgi:hypothetical protein
LSDTWRISVVDDARLQRYARAGAADFSRNEIIVALEKRFTSGAGLGLNLADRRRSVRAQRELGFSRQSGSVQATFAPALATRLRGELGLSHYSARTTSGQRMFAAGELVRVHGRGTVGARLEWCSGRLDIGGGEGASASFLPTVTPTPPPDPPAVESSLDPGRYLSSETEPVPGSAAGYAGPEIPVDALLVHPFEEEDDWDFGQTRVGASVFATRDLGRGWHVSGYAHLQRRSGRNLLSASTRDVSEDRLWLRAAVRRRLGARWNLVLQGSHLSSRVTEPTPDFSRTLGSLGLQFLF